VEEVVVEVVNVKVDVVDVDVEVEVVFVAWKRAPRHIR